MREGWSERRREDGSGVGWRAGRMQEWRERLKRDGWKDVGKGVGWKIPNNKQKKKGKQM